MHCKQIYNISDDSVQNFSQIPDSLSLSITGWCQLQCTHCYNFSSPQNNRELSLDKIVKILNEMQENGIKRLKISGGEPSLHKDFKNIIALCAKYNMWVGLNTNGLYNESFSNYCKNSPINVFFISIDGLENNNDNIRGQGVFKKVWKQCCQLREANKEVVISFHVNKTNQNDLEELVTRSAVEGIDIKVSPMRLNGRAQDNMSNDLLSSQNFYELVKKVNQLRKLHPNIRISTDFDILSNKQLKDKGNTCYGACGAGRSILSINFDGEIYPCCFFITPDKKFSAGNIDNISIMNAWNNSPIFKIFRAYQKPQSCKKCKFFQQSCLGGCSAVAYFNTGYIDSQDPMCFAHEL